MNIFLTLDYEIFFGEQHGSVEKCIIEPTDRLISIGRKHNITMTYFIDIGHILQLEKYKEQNPQLQKDYDLILNNIRSIVTNGNECQLHIHPHWESTTYNGASWKFDHSKYKLSDFDPDQIEDIVTRYKNKLEEISGQRVNAFRAGGWCLQSFDLVKEAFIKNGIKIDSTVFKGGFNDKTPYFYDFRETPKTSRWNFSNDLTKEDQNGEFLELTISNMTYKPWFFWRLFQMGRMNPKDHKPIGDGFPIPVKGYRKKVLSSSTNNPVSLDGYFAKMLNKALSKNLGEDFVVIGHPKACTQYSLKKLDAFISQNKNNHQFLKISEALTTE